MEKGIVTKELKQSMKKADTIAIIIREDKTEIICRKTVKKDGLEGCLESRHNGFKGNLPTGYKKASFGDRIYLETDGNYKALEKLIKINDELIFRALDNKNAYLDKAQILRSAWGDKNNYHTDYFGLHNDTLVVTIKRKGKVYLSNFEIDSAQCPDNSGRLLGN